MKLWLTLAAMLTLLLVNGCAGADDPTDETLDLQVGATTDTVQEYDLNRLGDLGLLRVTANYDGEVPDTASVVLVLFNCPFSMPPVAYGDYPSTEFPAVGDLPYIEPGHYCLMAYIDMNPGDGTHPIPGLDPEALPKEGESTIELDIEEGVATEVELDFEVLGEEPLDEDPGPQDVWIHARIICPNCPTEGKFVLYGAPGTKINGMPEYYYERLNPVYPFIVPVKESNLLGYKTPFPSNEELTLSAYHDIDGQGMGPEEGDHLGPTFTLKLVAGTFNKLTFTLD